MSVNTYLQFALALAFVLALIAGLAWAVRRFGLFAQVLPTRGGKKRISVVEVAAVDAKRRLVLVRRDDREHLLLLGATSETVVETGIEAPGPAMENQAR
jgi:flagellar protein FliO/FliZ